MTRNEIARALRRAGFREEYRRRHIVFRLHGYRVTMSHGSNVDPEFAASVKKILRRVAPH